MNFETYTVLTWRIIYVFATFMSSFHCEEQRNTNNGSWNKANKSDAKN